MKQVYIMMVTVFITANLFGQTNVGIGTATPNSTLDISGSLGTNITTISAATVLGTANSTVVATPSTSAAYIVTLPALSTSANRIITIIYNGAPAASGGNYAVTLKGAGSDGIIVAGASASNTYSLTEGSIVLQNNGTNWFATVTPASASSGNYIQNQTATDQAAGFRITGNGIFNGGKVGIGTTSPDASAALDVTSASKGISFPNVAITGVNDASTVLTPKKGLVIYNTAASYGTAGLYINTGTSSSPVWTRLSDANSGIQSLGVVSPLQSTGGLNPTLSIPQANSGTNGFLSSSDWTTFNDKESTTLSNGRTWIGDATNTAQPTAITGDATVNNTGTLTLATVNSNTGSFGTATAVPQLTLDGKGRITAASNVTITGTAPGGPATGDLSSNYPSPTVAKINGATLGTTTATNNNILIANGTQWNTEPVSGDASLVNTGALTLTTVNSNTGSFGSATQVPQLTLDGKGRVTGASNVTITGTAPGGTATGDLSGTYPSPTVAKINGSALGSTTSASNGQVLAWNSTNSDWEKTTLGASSITAGTGLAWSGNTLNSNWTLDGSNNLASNNSSGKVGINMTPAANLDVNGNANVSSGYYYGGTSAPVSIELIRNLPNTVGNCIDIGSFSITNGAHDIRISVVVSNGSFSEAKTYLTPVAFNSTSNVYQILVPQSSTGAYSGNDFAVDISVSNNTASFRLRRTAGTTDGSTTGGSGARVRIESVGSTTDAFTASTNLTTPATPTVYYTPSTYSALPSGIITMWSGTYANIPAGWSLCDGTNGTPNLLSSFILGVSSTGYTSGQINTTGGASTVTLTTTQLPAHTHTGTTDATTPTFTGTANQSTSSVTPTFTGTANQSTNSVTPSFTGTSNQTTSAGSAHSHTFSATTSTDPGHTHNLNTTTNYSGGGTRAFYGDNAGGGNDGTTTTSGVHSHTVSGTTSSESSHTHTYTASGSISAITHTFTATGTISAVQPTFTATGTVSSHTHTFTTNSTGTGSAFSILPPYYTLAYIMKL